MVAVVSPFAYGRSVLAGVGAGAGTWVAAQVRLGPWTQVVARLVGLAHALDARSRTVALLVVLALLTALDGPLSAGRWRHEAPSSVEDTGPGSPLSSVEAR